MAFCLPFEEANKIKKAIRNGTLNPDKLNKMTSQERREFFAKLIGKQNAKEVNLLFEKKLLLKNQERAMTDWARDITGISKEQKEATLEKIRQTYADKKRRLQDPKENEVFLNEIVSDVYSRKFKTETSLEEAQTITELSQDTKRAREKLGDLSKWKTEEFDLTGSKQDAIQFGATKVALDNYIGGLKAEAKKEFFVNPLKVRGLMEKIEAIKTDARISVKFIADNSRAIVASVDNSLWGRQGIKVLYTHPKTWATNFAKSWGDISKTLREGVKTGEAILDATKAEVYSRENFMKGRYELGKKLDIGTGEEEFPTSLPSKIPGLGRLFKAAEVSYEAGAMRLRADIADLIYGLAEQTGVDMNNKVEVGAINEMVNSMTGRGKLPFGIERAAGVLNTVFFSAKFFQSNVDTLTKGLTAETSFTRKQNAINLLKITSSIAVILLMVSAFDDDAVEWDPRSANFGKIKLGNKRFDTTGGMSSLIILAARLATQSTKSSVTGLITEYNTGYGSPTGMDALWNFTENKFSPLFSVIKEVVDQKTFEGEEPTFVNQLANLTVPIIIEVGMDAAQKEDLADTLLVLIADGLGISTNIYSYNKNWNVNPGKELIQFKEKVGEKKFKEANDKFNDLVNEKIIELGKDPNYQKLDDEDKRKKLTSEKNKIKSKIFRKHRFKYKRTK
ncbi:MAG TPA: hypothetical protein ENH85_02835 [Candidatus Scalindua sp.]|nr:hypothetical protein [Candidatus Scalindua sp.]